MENKKLNFRTIEFSIQAIVYIIYLVVNLFYLRRFHYVSCGVVAFFWIKNTCLLKSKVCHLPSKELRKKWGLMYPLYVLALVLITELLFLIVDCSLGSGVAFLILFYLPFVVIVVSLIGELIQIIRERIEKVRKQYIHIYLCVLRWCMVSLLIVFAIGTDQFYATTRVQCYEKAVSRYWVSDSETGFFPETIPKEAKNIEFYHTPGDILGDFGHQLYLKMTVPEEYIHSLIKKYEKIDDYKIIQNCSVLTKKNNKKYFGDKNLYGAVGEYFGKESCTIYFLDRGNSGFVVDTATNEVKLFYDWNLDN